MSVKGQLHGHALPEDLTWIHLGAGTSVRQRTTQIQSPWPKLWFWFWGRRLWSVCWQRHIVNMWRKTTTSVQLAYQCQPPCIGMSSWANLTLSWTHTWEICDGYRVCEVIRSHIAIVYGRNYTGYDIIPDYSCHEPQWGLHWECDLRTKYYLAPKWFKDDDEDIINLRGEACYGTFLITGIR